MDRAKEDLEAAVSNHEAGFYKVAINGPFFGICKFWPIDEILFIRYHKQSGSGHS